MTRDAWFSNVGDEAEMNQIGDAFGIEKRYTNYNDVLADPDVDFVHINTPIPDHAPLHARQPDVSIIQRSEQRAKRNPGEGSSTSSFLRRSQADLVQLARLN